MKRPAFQFYPADWRKDPALSACSLAARGLWIELMCIAHESEEYGYLSINGKPMNEGQLARMVGESPKVLNKLLREIEDAGVFSRREDGAIYSRRMVKDERIRNVRAEAGKLGGNPNLVGGKDKQIDSDLLNQTDKQKPTPSSSSSSSSSVKNSDQPELVGDSPKPAAKQPAQRGKRLSEDWVLPKPWGEWALDQRKDWTPHTVRQVADKFRDYWTAKAGADATKLDWQATWRNWVRNEPTQGVKPNGISADRDAFVTSFAGSTTTGNVIEGCAEYVG